MELLTIHKSLVAAKCPEDVFGGTSDGKTIIPVYRQLIVAIHPDHFESDPKLKPIADETFQLLTDLKGAAERKVKAKTYGQKTVAAPDRKAPFSPIVLESKTTKYILIELLAHGDLCDTYLATKGDSDEKVVVKAVRHGSDNDLVENEVQILNKIRPSNAPEVEFYRLLPHVLETFIVRSPGSQRRVIVMPWYNDYRAVSEILQVFPDGIDFRDMVWMFKRTLMILGHIHEQGIVHGAILPSHILIHPVNHGIRLLNWSYAVTIPPKKPKLRASIYDHLHDDSFLTSGHIKAISAGHRSYYPPEVFKKLAATPAIDIYMAAKCAVALVGGNVETNSIPDSVPKPLQAFFASCLLPKPESRPQNAWEAHDQFNAILEKVVGPRKYRLFVMPT